MPHKIDESRKQEEDEGGPQQEIDESPALIALGFHQCSLRQRPSIAAPYVRIQKARGIQALSTNIPRSIQQSSYGFCAFALRERPQGNPKRPTLKRLLLRILIVDDSASMRTALRRIIDTYAGLHVCGEARNGAEGISEAAGLKPDVVVLDFSMPVMNGIEAALQIRKSVPAAHLLMFSSYGTAVIEDAARSASIEGFIEKDNPAKLLQALRQFERESKRSAPSPYSALRAH